ncbi:MAG: S8 family serine peptidase [Acidobacteriota bacterium]
MKMRLLFLSVVLGVLIASSAVVAEIGSLDAPARDKSAVSFREAATARISSYRSPGSLRKVVIDSSDAKAVAEASAAGATEIADYGSFKLFVIDHTRLAFARHALAEEKTASRLLVRDDFNALFLRSGVIDTTDENSPGAFFGLGSATPLYEKQTRGDNPLRLVQFIGPVKREWVDELRASGMEIIAYVPNNGYLVRGDEQSRDRLIRAARRSHARGKGFIQWEGEFANNYKIHPALASLIRQPEGEVTVAVQIARSDRSADPRLDTERARRLALSILVDAYEVQGMTNLKMRIRSDRISSLAELASVVNIEPWSPPRLMDERAAQIVAAALTDDGKQPLAAGYMQWLNARGFHSTFDFAIDVTDSGLDRGMMTADKLHPDFLDSEGRSRVVYARDFTAEGDAGDPFGHGTINASIAAGANLAQSSRDPDGYLYGLGVAPFAQLASSKIFLSSGRFDLFEPYSNLILRGYESGARISSNSWAAITNEYTLDSQEYDSRVRDALPNQRGSQEMAIVFAAGNSGLPETIGSPGTAKNVITVGASENFRKQGTDGCNIKDADADSALDMAFFSSQGPLFDGRIKPDIVAPGSHITGAASQHADYDGNGVCGEDFDKPYFPGGQTLYTWSSGTSHSTPIVAGAAALARQHFLDQGMEPNAALIKALLLCTTTYMDGALAGGNLPHSVQGWGLLNLDRAFDQTPKIFINQTELLTVTGEEFTFTGEIKDASRPFRVTLAWSDAPAFSAFASWVNDLDLEVVVNGQVYRGNNFRGQVSQTEGEPDTKNNVEAVWLPAGTKGTFLVRVRLANLAGDAVSDNLISADQDFALVVYNGEKKEVPVSTFDSAMVTAGANGVPDPGETVSMKVKLGNASTTVLASGRGTLTAMTAGVTVTTNEADFPQIARGETAESLTPFVFNVASTVACGTELEFALDNGASQVRFKVRVGLLEQTGLFADDIESGEAKWTHASGIKKKKKRIDTWSISTRRFRSGASAWFSADLAKTADAHLDSIPIQIPANSRTVRLVFYHTFSFEPGQFDGGVLEISTGGDFEDLGEKIIEGGYNGKIRAGTSNPVANRPGWVDGRLGQFERVVVDLSSYAGRTVMIRFRIGSDSSLKGLGWYIDDVTMEGERPVCSAAAR